MTSARRIAVEAVGTAFLLAAVVGSGIMGERLAGGNVGLALLANTLATGAMLVTLILTFGPISGAHFNPAVTLADASQGGVAWREVPVYIAAQVLGAGDRDSGSATASTGLCFHLLSVAITTDCETYDRPSSPAASIFRVAEPGLKASSLGRPAPYSRCWQ
jgi:hypothetical protein